jgi:hypothetical protein
MGPEPESYFVATGFRTRITAANRGFEQVVRRCSASDAYSSVFMPHYYEVAEDAHDYSQKHDFSGHLSEPNFI